RVRNGCAYATSRRDPDKAAARFQKFLDAPRSFREDLCTDAEPSRHSPIRGGLPMTRWHPIAAVLLLVLACAPVRGDDKAPPSIDKLVRQLGSDEQDDRDQAEDQLRELGPKALDALRRVTDHSDAEIRRRARKLVSDIELKQTTEALLAPKKVRLKCD